MNRKGINLKDVYLFGTNSIARQLLQYMKGDSNYRVLGLTLNGEYCTSNDACGFPLIPFEEIATKGGDFGIINCIGNSKAFSVRQKIDDMINDKGIPLLSYVHETADIEGGVEMGAGCLVFNYSHVGEFCKIGNSNIIRRASIGHDSIVGDYNWFSRGSVCAGKVTVEDHCYIGINATITASISLASYTVVGHAAYVNKNTVMYEVLSPAKTVSIKYNKPLFLD